MEYGSNASADMHTVIVRMAKNMRFLGTAYVIFGALYCLSIIGALIGIPVLLGGLRLRESADSFGDWLNQEEGALLRALERQGRYFSIHAILLIVVIVLSVLGVVMAGLSIFAVMGSGIY